MRKRANQEQSTGPGSALPEQGSSLTLVGRISGVEEKVMPSGDEITTFRVVVDRPPKDRGPSGKVRVDTIPCSAWTKRVRGVIGRCAAGDLVEVHGVLRRRFFRAQGVPTSRIEVDVRAVRRL
ncbi:MAG: single-stranded DNA-binding protein [Candidatus Nanopelagicales bacterium]|nr:single-stranded DNA-binding protein [Candidatus Nanopelagicales bacterium]